MKKFNCVLESIPPSKIIDKSRIDDLDNFFLVLGLIFNDLKGLILFNDLLKKNYDKPRTEEINAHAGEYTGIQIQITKLSIALINEFLITLEKNEHVVKNIKFKLIEKKLNGELKNKWNNILSIALNSNNNSYSYLSKIARVRSNIVYHYDHSGTQLRSSFIRRFFEIIKDESNKKAFYSIGETMESTRFFYCDAMIHEYLNEHLKIDAINYFEKTNKIIKDMNEVIVNLMKNYLLYKKNKK